MDDSSVSVTSVKSHSKDSIWRDYQPKIGWGKTTDGTLITWSKESLLPEVSLSDRISATRNCLDLSVQLQCKLEYLKLGTTKQGRLIYRDMLVALEERVEDPIEKIIEQQE